MRAVAARAKELERDLAVVEADLQQALAPLPNLPDPTAAPGPEDEVVRVRRRVRRSLPSRPATTSSSPAR